MRKAAYQMSAAAIATDLCSVAVEVLLPLTCTRPLRLESQSVGPSVHAVNHVLPGRARQRSSANRLFYVGRLVFIVTRDQFQDHGDQVDKSWVEHHTMNFTSHGETFLPDEEADSERQDCFVISHLFGVMGHGRRKKAEAQQLSIDDIV